MATLPRRRFMCGLAALVALPSPAQPPPGRRLRIGVVDNTIPLEDLTGQPPRDTNARILVAQLRELGWIEGKSVDILWRSVEERYERRPRVIEELVRMPVDVLLVYGNEAALEAKRATRTIPIIMMSAQGVLASGLVASLARPGGNVTGFEMELDQAVAGKRLALLKQAAPHVTRVAFLVAHNASRREFRPATLEAARSLGVSIVRMYFDGPASFEGLFAAAVRDGVNGLQLGGYSALLAPRSQPLLRELVVRHRLAAIHGGLDWTDAGAILNYGVDPSVAHRRAGFLIDRIFRGTPAGDLPIEQPTALILAANKRAAKAIGLTIPASVLAQADRIIE